MSLDIMQGQTIYTSRAQIWFPAPISLLNGLATVASFLHVTSETFTFNKNHVAGADSDLTSCQIQVNHTADWTAPRPASARNST
jgi:hypothetical protein